MYYAEIVLLVQTACFLFHAEYILYCGNYWRFFCVWNGMPLYVVVGQKFAYEILALCVGFGLFGREYVNVVAVFGKHCQIRNYLRLTKTVGHSVV